MLLNSHFAHPIAPVPCTANQKAKPEEYAKVGTVSAVLSRIELNFQQRVDQTNATISLSEKLLGNKMTNV